MGLPANFRRQGRLDQTAPADALAHVEGQAAILGQLLAATLAQVERHRAAGRAVMILDPVQLAEGAAMSSALAFAERHIGQGPVLFSSSAPPEEVAKIQARPARAGRRRDRGGDGGDRQGAGRAGRPPACGRGRRDRGAVVDALGVKALKIGPLIDPRLDAQPRSAGAAAGAQVRQFRRA